MDDVNDAHLHLSAALCNSSCEGWISTPAIRLSLSPAPPALIPNPHPDLHLHMAVKLVRSDLITNIRRFIFSWKLARVLWNASLEGNLAPSATISPVTAFWWSGIGNVCVAACCWAVLRRARLMAAFETALASFPGCSCAGPELVVASAGSLARGGGGGGGLMAFCLRHCS
eukprot:CAMPEP_0182593764 /NCGR_PEP_ID=MMETSP1324-20130603/78758_1 /TAXON_ID=236786 /ORGANISM="Florenciella sp., Strain RCC1587" /LENGTH=170 /DNA_ID=CAMNT_0024811255 /DNA_START=10 /DNA_END=522 /DNA_ORIENTATION=+